MSCPVATNLHIKSTSLESDLRLPFFSFLYEVAVLVTLVRSEERQEWDERLSERQWRGFVTNQLPSNNCDHLYD